MGRKGTFMAATSQAQAEATKAAQRAGIEHAKQSGDRAYLGRKASYTREQFNKVRAMLGQETVSIAHIARETGLTRQTVYRIKGDPAGAEGALGVWGCEGRLLYLPPIQCDDTGRRRRFGVSQQVPFRPRETVPLPAPH